MNKTKERIRHIDAPSVADKRRENQKPDKQVRNEQKANDRAAVENAKATRTAGAGAYKSAEGYSAEDKEVQDVRHGMAPTSTPVDPDDDGPDGVRRVDPNDPAEEVKVGTKPEKERIKRPDLAHDSIPNREDSQPNAEGRTGREKDYPSQGGPNVV